MAVWQFGFLAREDRAANSITEKSSQLMSREDFRIDAINAMSG